MKYSLLRVFTAFFTLTTGILTIHAQEKKACGTMYAEDMRRTKNPALGSLDDFEKWLQEKIIEKQNNPESFKTQQVYNIPVVVHVINSGEAVGTGRNISNAQINSQITVLNNDFRKLNSDITSVPSVWSSVAADCEINFCMALKNPSGATLSSPGIDRVNVSSWGFNSPPYTISYFDNIKSSTIWDPNKYLNIWVADVSDPSVGGTLLGWATFPPGSGLSGISSGNIGTLNDDGVVIYYKAFGTTGTAISPNNKGRTTTHEVGHWLGLRHTWGDDNGTCNGTDHCNDTPNQTNPTYGAPNFPRTDACSPSSPGTMFMNFMNYVDDASMYMFSNDQKTRIQTVMANSSYRKNAAAQLNCLGASIDEENAQNLSVYPNPASDRLNFDFTNKPSENTQVKIYSVLGNVVSFANYQPASSQFSIDISGFAEGIYFIEAQNGSTTHLKKIVIAR